MNLENIEQEFEQIKKRKGKLHPESVVEFASTHRKSELGAHSGFIWDDKQAAHEQRLEHARGLIKLVIWREPSTPKYISLSIDRVTGGGYRSFEQVQDMPNLRAVAVADILREFTRLRDRYRDLTELTPIFMAIDSMSVEASEALAATA